MILPDGRTNTVGDLPVPPVVETKQEALAVMYKDCVWDE